MAGVIIGVVLGVVIGWIIGRFTYKTKPIGNLRIDSSDPDDGPYLFLELSSKSTPNLLKLKKYVTLEVKVENYVSHK